MFKKAITFNNHNTAEQILKEKDPVELRKLGSNIANFNKTVWKNKCLEIIERGLKTKLEHLTIKEFLILLEITCY